MSAAEEYAPLTSKTLPARLGGIGALTLHLGDDAQKWQVNEVGDGTFGAPCSFVSMTKECIGVR